ncbi:hypothetical protein O7602_19825 [Micromonospora sp. WMMD1128]|nr:MULTISPECIES: hypothetical protein [unclassified Micromonospora]WBB71977.1 hypothetical protein O7602_19825 [Micromonospora sp. WMMD1128]WFE34565.1 hypothetical protein O7613_04050 [Micromonospora sp. WMMD975]
MTVAAVLTGGQASGYANQPSAGRVDGMHVSLLELVLRRYNRAV